MYDCREIRSALWTTPRVEIRRRVEIDQNRLVLDLDSPHVLGIPIEDCPTASIVLEFAERREMGGTE